MGEIRQRAESDPATNWTRISVAILILVLGTAVYVLDRPAGAAPFFDPVSFSHWFPRIFGQLGENLPTFSHVFGFSLLTAAWLGGGRRVGLGVCLGWWFVDTVFELGQHAAVAQRVFDLLPDGLGSVPILSLAERYFLFGTFDTGDLLSIGLGAIGAYLVILLTPTARRSA